MNRRAHTSRGPMPSLSSFLLVRMTPNFPKTRLFPNNFLPPSLLSCRHIKTSCCSSWEKTYTGVHVHVMCVMFAPSCLNGRELQVGTVTAEDFMDDGTPIRLAVTIDRASRSARFDFTGTVRGYLTPHPPLNWELLVVLCKVFLF